MKSKIITVLILLLVSLNFIFADGVVKIKCTDAEGTEINTSSIMVQDEILRLTANFDGKEQIILFDSDDERLYQIIDSEKKYITFSSFDLEKASRDIDDAMDMVGSLTKGAAETLPGVAEDVASFFGASFDADKEVEKAVGNLKGDDKKMAEDAMSGDLKGYVDDEIDKPEYSKVESGVDINGWKCDKYVGTIEDKTVEEVWIANSSSTEVGTEFTEAFEKFESFIELLAKPNDEVSQDLWEETNGWFVDGGIPVKQILYKDGKVVSVAIVEEISSNELDEDLFDTPSGYKEENPFRSNMDSMFDKYEPSHRK